MDDARLAGDLNRGRLVPRLFTFGIPLVAGMFFHSLFNLADLIIVGKLGPFALAAVNQASLVGFIPMLICTGVNTASIAVIARNFGMRNYRRANANALQAFLLLLMLAVALGVPSYLWADLLDRLVGSTGEALPAANDYLRITSAGMFTMFLLMQVTAQLRAGGNAQWPMILLIGANVLNVLLTIGLVYGVWILPELGVAGAAWGTVIARGLFAIFGLYLVTRQASPVRLDLRRIRLRLRMIGNLARLGIPSSLQFVVRVVGYGAILNLVTRFGQAEDMHAALAVGFRLDLLAIFTGAGWGGAAAAMVGQALGGRQLGRAVRAGWVAVLFDVTTMGGIGVLYFIYAHWLVTVFGEDPTKDPRFFEMHRMGVEYVRITVFCYPFAAVAITLAHALNGAGSTKTPLVLDSIVLVMQLPIAAYVCLTHRENGYGPPVLWWSLVLTTVVAAALYAMLWEWGRWKHKRVQ